MRTETQFLACQDEVQEELLYYPLHRRWRRRLRLRLRRRRRLQNVKVLR